MYLHPHLPLRSRYASCLPDPCTRTSPGISELTCPEKHPWFLQPSPPCLVPLRRRCPSARSLGLVLPPDGLWGLGQSLNLLLPGCLHFNRAGLSAVPFPGTAVGPEQISACRGPGAVPVTWLLGFVIVVKSLTSTSDPSAIPVGSDFKIRPSFDHISPPPSTPHSSLHPTPLTQATKIASSLTPCFCPRPSQSLFSAKQPEQRWPFEN